MGLAPRRADLVVVGGGATGSAVLRAAALAGARAVLVEEGDFGGGTTAKTSRLVHGGLRYLAAGDLALVREALRARNELSRTASHLVAPFPFVVLDRPAPARLGPPWAVRAAVAFYRLLGADRTIAARRR